MINVRDCRYVFVGNRYYVYRKMVENGLDITKVIATPGSYLEQYLIENKISYEVLTSKAALIEELQYLDYDILVSNGCPYILPISALKNGKPNSAYINVHPSLLPDCRGKSPINAALLFGRRHGVTCHYMDDGVDTGIVIDQIEIPITDDISLDLLYRLSFMAEGDVFEKALQSGFEERGPLYAVEHPIYYSRKESDYYLKDNEDVDTAIRRVRAFSSKGQYAKIIINGTVIDIARLSRITNPYLLEMTRTAPNGEVILGYGDAFLMKRQGVLLEFVTANGTLQ